MKVLEMITFASSTNNGGQSFLFFIYMHNLIRKDQFSITAMRNRKYFVTYEPDNAGVIMMCVVSNYILVESVLTDDEPCQYTLMHMAQEVQASGMIVTKAYAQYIYELRNALREA